MTSCREGCGACCAPVMLPCNRWEYLADPGLSERARRWVAEDLRPMRPRDAVAALPWLGEERRPTYGLDAGEMTFGTFYFSCRHFDPETRSCRDYDDRPESCRQYPLYGAERLADNIALPPMCSCRADVGQPVEPIPVAWRGVKNAG